MRWLAVLFAALLCGVSAEGAAAGATVAQPTCPGSISGAQQYTLVQTGQVSLQGSLASLNCTYGPTAHPSYGGGDIVIYWRLVGAKDFNRNTEWGCGRSDNVAVDIPSADHFAYAYGTGNISYRIDPAAGTDGATKIVAGASGFAEPCGAASTPTSSAAAATSLTVRVASAVAGVVFRPTAATVKNKATITICDTLQTDSYPFSLSRYNAFHTEIPGKSIVAGKHARGPALPGLRSGKCLTRTMSNPTKQPITIKLYDGIHSQARAVITVLP